MGAIHLVVLYIFIQTVVDFPLALIDYYNGTDYLYNPLKKILLGVGSTLFIFYFAYRRAGVPLRELFPMKYFNLLAILPLITFFWAAQNIITEINLAFDKILPPPSWFWELFNKVFESDFGVYGAILKVVIVAPIIEELIFRGAIMYGLMRNYSKFTAVFVSALMFALFHLNPWQFPATFTLGLLLGFLRIRTNSMLPCIAGHSINNGLALIAMLFGAEISQTAFFQMEKNQQLLISLAITVLSLLTIIVLVKKRKIRSN